MRLEEGRIVLEPEVRVDVLELRNKKLESGEVLLDCGAEARRLERSVARGVR